MVWRATARCRECAAARCGAARHRTCAATRSARAWLHVSEAVRATAAGCSRSVQRERKGRLLAQNGAGQCEEVPWRQYAQNKSSATVQESATLFYNRWRRNHGRMFCVCDENAGSRVMLLLEEGRNVYAAWSQFGSGMVWNGQYWRWCGRRR